MPQVKNFLLINVITLLDVPIHSALETGRPPTIEHIAGMINSHIVPNSVDTEFFSPVPIKVSSYKHP